MAHTKSKGSTALGRDSISKRLGVKLFSGQQATPGSILIRQRGTKYGAGLNVKKGEDDTLYSRIAGVVSFTKKKVRKFNGKLQRKTFVHVNPVAPTKTTKK